MKDKVQVAIDAGLGVIVAVGIGLCLTVKAKSAELTITRGVPTVLGIPQGTPPVEAYRSKPTVNVRPAARVMHLREPASANGCAVPAFEVISGPKAQRGCYGALN